MKDRRGQTARIHGRVNNYLGAIYKKGDYQRLRHKPQKFSNKKMRYEKYGKK